VNNLTSSLNEYRDQLKQLRSEYGGAKEMPAVDFFLFGMGNRPKMIFKEGRLISFPTGNVIGAWEVDTCTIVPNEFSIIMQLQDGRVAILSEDEKGIKVIENGTSHIIFSDSSKIYLPGFEGHKYGEVLKVLHQEILVNILDGLPLPNYLVYDKPWRRDAAMMAMCLEKTGNIELIRDWILGLDDPYDHNNGQKQGKPEDEADNLGQSLYLISKVADKSHPLVKKTLQEIPRFEVRDDYGHYIKGRSDFQEVPVYQTKWLIYGLDQLGLKHEFNVPLFQDNYSSLFWWDYQDQHVRSDAGRNYKYPYLGWARDHFHNHKDGLISDRNYPLTWEIEASQAEYSGMSIIDSIFTESKTSVPHTWHGAEVFLYLLDTDE
jgi:hypothetical protein